MNSRIITGNRTSEDIIREYYERLKNKKLEENKQESEPRADAIIPASIQDPEKYILLPGKKHGNYE